MKVSKNSNRDRAIDRSGEEHSDTGARDARGSVALPRLCSLPSLTMDLYHLTGFGFQSRSVVPSVLDVAFVMVNVIDTLHILCECKARGQIRTVQGGKSGYADRAR